VSSRVLACALCLSACASAPPAEVPPPPCDPWSQPAPDIELTDVAPELGLDDPETVNNGMAAEDFDGDGDIDIYLANPGPPSRLLLQRDDGTFARHPRAPTSGSDTGPAAVDYDGDGDADLYLACGRWEQGCASRLFRNDGLDDDGLPVFVDATAEAGLLDREVSNFGGAWADYDGDGDLDLFQGCKALRAAPDVPSEDQLYRNDGDGTFTEVADEAGVASPGDSHQAVWLDFDEDGFPDLYVPVLAGPNVLLRNRGDGTFEDVTTAPLQDPFTAFAAVASDFDNDGHTDLLVSGRYGPEMEGLPDLPMHGLYLSDGAGGWRDLTFGTGLNEPGDSATSIPTMGLQVGDLDLDGYPEVVFGNGSPDSGAVNALGSFVPTDQAPGLRWVDRTHLIDVPPAQADGLPEYPYRSHGMGFFDVDQDGDVDLFMGNGGGMTAEPNRMWRNEQEAAHGLILRLDGAGANSAGVGAKVRVADGPEGAHSWAVHRDFWPSSGFNSWLPRELRIGTGRCGGPYHVTVTWPSGATSVVPDAEEQAPLTVVE